MKMNPATKMESFFDDLHQRVPLLRRETIENITVPQIYIPGSDYDPDYIRKAQLKLTLHSEFPEVLLPLTKELHQEITSILSAPKTSQLLEKFSNEIYPSTHFFVNHFARFSGGLLSPSMKKFFKKFFENRSNQIEQNSFLKNLATRMDKIRPNALSKTVEAKKGESAFDRTLGFGFANTIKRAWSFFVVIPSVFFTKYKRLPSPSEYRGIAKTSQKLLALMTSSQDDLNNLVHTIITRAHVLKDLNDVSKLNNDYVGIEKWSPLHPDDFGLNENDELIFSPELMDSLDENWNLDFQEGLVSLDEARVGCPAEVLIALIFNFCFKLAEQSIFKDPERIYQLNLQNGDI